MIAVGCWRLRERAPHQVLWGQCRAAPLGGAASAKDMGTKGVWPSCLGQLPMTGFQVQPQLGGTPLGRAQLSSGLSFSICPVGAWSGGLSPLPALVLQAAVELGGRVDSESLTAPRGGGWQDPASWGGSRAAQSRVLSPALPASHLLGAPDTVGSLASGISLLRRAWGTGWGEAPGAAMQGLDPHSAQTRRSLSLHPPTRWGGCMGTEGRDVRSIPTGHGGGVPGGARQSLPEHGQRAGLCGLLPTGLRPL